MKKRWKISRSDPEQVKQITRELNCNPIFAHILAIRKISDRETLDCFLNPTFKMMCPPGSIADLSKAAERVVQALVKKEKILIFSDFDVDGITSAILLLEFLGDLDADVEHYIPHRVKEGYGLKSEHITHLAQKKNFDLIITADCGSSSHEAAVLARTAGIDLIITDHHQVPDPMPDAHAIVNPHRKDCPSGLTYLAGVGVVFYLLIEVRKQLREKNFWKNTRQPNLKKYCDLVALGTVADIVPLIKENRVLTRAGVEVIQAGERLGLKTLMAQCKINPAKLDADDIAFQICPRINAAGRLSHADQAVLLFNAKDPKQALSQSRYLDQLNTTRKETVNLIFEQVLNYLKTQPQVKEKKTLVLAHHEWHIGVLGIVAAKLVEKFYRPVVLFSVQDGVGVGSARSIEGFDLYQGLCRCASRLQAFGGHKMAAGLTIRREDIHQFILDFENVAGETLKVDDFVQTLEVDMELSFDTISENLLNELETLKPFGNGNPEPLFLSNGVSVSFSKVIGQRHRRLVLYQAESRFKHKLQAIHFNADESSLQKDHFETLIYRLRPNYYNNSGNAFQIMIEACF